MINRVVLVGRLTKDPELRYSPSGVAVTTFTLAVDKPFKNTKGEKEADFFSIVVWRQLAELCANYLKKGSQTAIDGRLQSRSYDNKEGRRVYVTEVVAENVQFLTPVSKDSDSSQQIEDPFKNESRTVNINDDDLPF